MDLNKATKTMMRGLIDGIVLSLNNKSDDWKVLKYRHYEVHIKHKKKPIRILYYTTSGRAELHYKEKELYELPFWSGWKLKKAAKKRYLKYRAKRRLLKMSKMIEELK